MAMLYADNDKYAWQSTFAIVEAYNDERFSASTLRRNWR
jgi:hypothetical protein